MKDLIAQFPQDLIEAIDDQSNETLVPSNVPTDNVIICGLGGSGIGGAVATQLFADELSVPVSVVRDYNVPGYVNDRSLVIACSYSGNTEETLNALNEAQSKHAAIAAVTSGGTLGEIAEKEGYARIVIEGGQPPRSAFGKAFPKLLRLMVHFGLVSETHLAEVKTAGEILKSNRDNIMKEGKALADQIHNNGAIIYSDQKFFGVAERFRQQLNENAKVLCWHHFFPELNHNELVGWAGADDAHKVIYLRHGYENERTKERMRITKELIEEHAEVTEIEGQGASILEQALYVIHLCDWASYYLSELRDVDPVEVDVIDYLKGELKKL